jgi:hypothetical protein
VTKITIAILLTAMSSLRAQEPKVEFVTKVFQLKYADTGRVVKLLNRSGVVWDDQLRALVVSRPKSDMAEIEQMIQRFDVPPPPVQNIEVTIYLMSALGTPSSGAVPPELEAVVKQLKSTFSYKSYQLIDTQVMRVRAGQGGDVSGVVNGAPSLDGNKTISQVKFKSATVSTDEKGRAIRIDRLSVGFRVPVRSGEKQYLYIDTGISTDVDVREGQKVVVGKANMDGSDRASIVVLTAKVVE